MTAALVPVAVELAAPVIIEPPRTPDQIAAAFLAGYSSPQTRAAYRADLDAWREYLRLRNVHPWSVERLHVDVFARELEAHGAARATVARKLSTLAGFYGYAVSAGLLTSSPVEHVRRPRVSDETQTLGLDRDQLVRLLDVAKASGARDHALVCLLALNGLRVSEAVGADVADLSDHDGHRLLRLHRKGGREQFAVLPPRARGAVDDWLAVRAEYVTDPECVPLFVTRSGRRMDRQAMWKVVRRLARDAGIVGISPHSLRHAFVTLCLRAGAPLHDVQDAAGHADPRTTRRYDRNRHSIDRHPSHRLAVFLAAA
ncbi:MAG: tyrosine-type recombinase/integrase [Conexibacter sp.]